MAISVDGDKKTRMMGLPVREGSLMIIFHPVDTVHQRDRRTDIQTWVTAKTVLTHCIMQSKTSNTVNCAAAPLQ